MKKNILILYTNYGTNLNIPYVSDIDREDIKYACETGGEYLAISFVSCKEDVMEIKELLKYGISNFISLIFASRCSFT